MKKQYYQIKSGDTIITLTPGNWISKLLWRFIGFNEITQKKMDNVVYGKTRDCEDIRIKEHGGARKWMIQNQ